MFKKWRAIFYRKNRVFFLVDFSYKFPGGRFRTISFIIAAFVVRAPMKSEMYTAATKRLRIGREEKRSFVLFVKSRRIGLLCVVVYLRADTIDKF